MAYATPAQLRARFLRAGVDEFVLRTDDELEQALAAASNEIDSYRPSGEVSEAGLAVLTEKCLVLARMQIYQDQALDAAHPVVREGLAVRSWLGLLARGAVHLPVDDPPASEGSIATGQRTLYLGADFEAGYPL